MKSNKDIFEILKEEHRQVENLFKKIERTESNSEKQNFFTELKKELSAHASAEEDTFYQDLEAKRKTQEIAKHAEREHDKIRKCLSRAAELRPTDPQWNEALKKLQEEVEHHVEEEESELFSEMKKVFSEKELEMFKLEFLDAKEAELQGEQAA